MPNVRYNLEPGASEGEWISGVPGWWCEYPLRRGGQLRDIGFVSSRGYGGSDFVHFDRNGEPYGVPLTEAARQRFKAMRRDLGEGIRRA